MENQKSLILTFFYAWTHIRKGFVLSNMKVNTWHSNKLLFYSIFSKWTPLTLIFLTVWLRTMGSLSFKKCPPETSSYWLWIYPFSNYVSFDFDSSYAYTWSMPSNNEFFSANATKFLESYTQFVCVGAEIFASISIIITRYTSWSNFRIIFCCASRNRNAIVITEWSVSQCNRIYNNE